jgi:hypothetical protein
MHPYIPHLLQDITAAHRTERPCEERGKPFQEILEEFIEEQEGRKNTFGYFCGMQEEDFPPADQLMKKDIKLVSGAFKKMMRSWNLQCLLPKSLPPDLEYKLLIRMLNHKYNPQNSGMVQFAYCTMNPTNCLLEQHCTCLKIKFPKDGGDLI